jgi:molybdate transport system substrate-binding protein
MKAGLAPAADLYRRRTGVAVALEFQPMGPLTRRLTRDALPDLLVLTREAMDDAERRNFTAADTRTEIGRVAIGVAVHKSAPLPDISTPEAFCAAVLAAKSVVYIDPERGTSGAHVATILQELGIAEAVKAKAICGTGGAVVEPVARGEVELGIHQITAMLEVPDVRVVGPLPPALQKETVYVGAASLTTRRRATVAEFLRFLRTAEIRALFAAGGFIETA